MSEGLEKNRIDRSKVVGIIFTVFASVLLKSLNILSILFIFPIMAFASVNPRKEWWKVILPTSLIVFFKSLYDFWGIKDSFLWMLFDMYVPVSLLAAGAIWLYIKPRRVERRLFLCLLPSLLIALVIGVTFYLDRALFEEVYNTFQDAFVALMSEPIKNLGLDLDLEQLFLLSSMTVVVFVLPVITAAVCVSIFFYENKKHSREGGFDSMVAGIELSQNTIWFLILFLLLFLLCRFVSIPLVVSLVSMSLLITTLELYAIQGFSVIVWRVVDRGMNIRSSQLLIWILILSLIFPGLNIIVFLALPLLGILENFFDLKKRGK